MLLVTGGAGFIGSNFINYVLTHNADVEVVNFDALTYAGNLENLVDVRSSPRYHFVHGNVELHNDLFELFEKYHITDVVNFAADSHVYNSIINPLRSADVNFSGTQNLLDISRKRNVTRFIHCSSDEVYGSVAAPELSREDSQLLPNNPYSASKAAIDLMIRAYVKTYNFPAIITRSSNNYGPYQFPEKLIPKFITRLLWRQPAILDGNGENIRDWIHVTDNCAGIYEVWKRGRLGEIYNIGGGCPLTNYAVASKIVEYMNIPLKSIQFGPDRPANDLRYSLDTTKMKDLLGWSPSIGFNIGLLQTIKWYVTNEEWAKKSMERAARIHSIK